MSRIVRIRPTAAALVGAVAAAVALAGCGAGQITQTDTQVSAVDGANVMVGDISLRNTQIEFNDKAQDRAIYPRGGNAPLSMSIVNTGAQADRLVSVTSPVANSVQIIGSPDIPGGQTLLIEGGAPAPAAPGAPGTPATPGASVTDTPATPGAPAPTTAAGEAAALPTTAAPAPAAGGIREASIVLTGLREDITNGPTYPVTLTFEHAGTVQVPVPVANSSEPRENQPE